MPRSNEPAGWRLWPRGQGVRELQAGGGPEVLALGVEAEDPEASGDLSHVLGRDHHDTAVIRSDRGAVLGRRGVVHDHRA